jgi:enoyl-CoA hydratase/carnithine racemase
VQKICEPDKLIDDCMELCTTINRNGRLIAAHTTEYLDKLLYDILGWEKGFEVHREYYQHLRQSKDYDEGSAAFSERRKPEFQAGILRQEEQAARSALSRRHHQR